MAEISKIILPDGSEYDIKVYEQHFSGIIPITKGGTGGATAAVARSNLELGTAATSDTTNVVNNNTNLPTGAAVQTYVSNYITVSSTQPLDQPVGGIWVVLDD